MAVCLAVAGKIPIACCLELIDKIYDCICVAKDNDERCEHIVAQVEVIKATLLDLERAKTISESLDKAISFLGLKLRKCEEYIDSLCDRNMSRPRDFLQARGISGNLQRLKDDVDSACTAFIASASVQNLLHAQDVDIGGGDTKSLPVPGKPINLTVCKRAHNKVQLSWDEPDDNPGSVHSYEVHYRRRWKKWTSCEKKAATTTKHTVTGLSADTYYCMV